MKFDHYADITTLASDDIFMVGQLQEDDTFKFRNISVENAFASLNADVSALQAEIDAEEVARASADALLQPLSQKGQANGYAPLNGSALIDPIYLPNISITDTFVVASQAAMLALTAQTGDVAVRTDLNKTFILKGTDPAVLADWQELLTPTDSVTSVNGRTGAVTGLAELNLANTFTASNLFTADVTVQDVLFADTTNDILFVGGGTTTGLTNPAFVVKKAHTGSDGVNCRGVTVESTIDVSGTPTFVCYDANGLTIGSNNYDFLVGFEGRPKHTSTGTLNHYMSFTSIPNAVPGSGQVTNCYGYYAFNPTDGDIVNNFGIYIALQTRGDINYAIYTQGVTPSVFEGVVSVANATADGHALNRLTADGRYFQQSATIPINRGGTGQTTQTLAFNALSPLTTLGDINYHNGTNNVRLPGNTTAVKQFLSQTGTGSASAAPVWGALVAGDIPNLSASYIQNQTSAQAGANFNISGTGIVGVLLANTASLGSHVIQGGGTGILQQSLNGDHSFTIRNTSTGTSALSLFAITADAGQLSISMHSSTHSSFADRARIIAESTVSGGLDVGTNGDFNVRIIRNGSSAGTFTSAGFTLPGTFMVTGISTMAGRVDNNGGITVGAGATLTKFLSASATIDFPNTVAGTASTSDITVTGAAIGDRVNLGLDPSVIPGDTENVRWEAWVQATNTVRIRVKNMMPVTSFNPPSAVFVVDVYKTT